MKYTTLLTGSASAVLLSTAHARIVTPCPQPHVQHDALAPRALPANAPHGYTPQINACPSNTPTVRSANTLSSNETAWLEVRRNVTLQPMRDLLGRMNITGLDTTAYINDHMNNASALPNIAIAASGGGYRAMLNGAGVVEAFDDRTPNSTNTGQLGGLLQSATYLAGLSGGSWLVGSLVTNNFTSVDQILAQDSAVEGSGTLWQLGNSIFQGPAAGGIQLLDSVGYYAALQDAVSGKGDEFNTTITDYWGRALSYQLVNATDGGPAFTFSSIAQQDWFTSGNSPLPLIVADGRAPGQKIVSANSTVYTFDPWELGSFDPTVFGFVPLQYIGTNFSAGTPANSQECVTGFDNVGFTMGTSSSLFNSILTVINGTDTTGLLSSALQEALTSLLSNIGQANDDIADYPNPFYHFHNETNPNAISERLTLVDGGEDGQNIPLNPLIQPLRNVDVIFAIDSSADTTEDNGAPGWPNGTSLIATYERSQAGNIENGTAFPSIPDSNTFVNLGLNNHPTFFGCDANNLTGPAPLIVYLPNAPYVYQSNTSTFDMSYNDTERNAMIMNGYEGATLGNGTLDAQWPTCVGCAILSRSLTRTGNAVPDVCNQCFERYCWNGTLDSSTPPKYDPAMKLDSVSVKSAGHRTMGVSTMAVITSALVAAAFLI